MRGKLSRTLESVQIELGPANRIDRINFKRLNISLFDIVQSL